MISLQRHLSKIFVIIRVQQLNEFICFGTGLCILIVPTSGFTTCEVEILGVQLNKTSTKSLVRLPKSSSMVLSVFPPKEYTEIQTVYSRMRVYGDVLPRFVNHEFRYVYVLIFSSQYPL